LLLATVADPSPQNSPKSFEATILAESGVLQRLFRSAVTRRTESTLLPGRRGLKKASTCNKGSRVRAIQPGEEHPMFQTLSPWRSSTVAIFLFTALSATSGCKTAPDQPAWTGEGERRILVRVDPEDVGARASDEMVAGLPIDFAGWLAKHGIAGKVDLASLQVHKYNLQRNNSNSGGGYIQHNQEQYLIRGEGLVNNPDDINTIVVSAQEDGTPIYIRNLGKASWS
jgi:hypothetical protein